MGGWGGGEGSSSAFNFLLFFSSFLAPPRSLFIPLERKRQVSAAIALSVCVCVCLCRVSDHPTANLVRPSCFPLFFLFFPVSLFRHVSQFPIASQLYLQTRLSGFYCSHSVRSESVSVVKCMLASQDFTPSLLSFCF